MSSPTQSIPMASPSTRAKELALNARKLLEELKGLEAGIVMESKSNDWQQQPQQRRRCTKKPSSSTSSEPRRGRSLPSYQISPPPPPTTAAASSYQNHDHDHSSFWQPHHRSSSTTSSTSTAVFEEPIVDRKKHHVTSAFVTFCDHLLYMNRIWKQEEQIRGLRASIRAIEKEKSSHAFKSFCDRLLESNRIWQLERQIRELVEEGERDRRARVAAVAHAAKQMAVDVRKEAMIEEFVVELVEELEESKRRVGEMRDGHEREVREIQGDWLKEYRRVVVENERMRLEHHSRLVEQEVANELEQSLVEALGWSRERIGELENADLESTLVGDMEEGESILFSGSEYSVDDTLMDDPVDIDEGMSTTSSATYVSSERGASRSAKLGKRASHASLRAAALRRQSLRKLDVTPYAGFSFNPLFFGNTETLVVSPSRVVESPAKVSLKHVSSSKTSLRERMDSVTVKNPRSLGPTATAGTRAPWRV